MALTDVVFTTGSGNALDLLLGVWPLARTAACLPGEYGPNLAQFAAHGFTCTPLPVGALGRLDLEAAETALRKDTPAMVHLTALGSHRGVVQPLSELATICRDIGVPMVVDAAQALGHIDCVSDADAIYSSSRKWLAGPRGVGVLAVRPALADLLHCPEWAGSLSALQCLELGEANIAARVGFSVAVGEHVAAGPAVIRRRLAELGRTTRAILADVRGWRVVEPEDEPTAITTLEPTDGADPAAVRGRLIAEHRIVTTAAGLERAPLEMRTPVLRVAPHVDSTAEDLESFAAALTVVTG